MKWWNEITSHEVLYFGSFLFALVNFQVSYCFSWSVLNLILQNISSSHIRMQCKRRGKVTENENLFQWAFYLFEYIRIKHYFPFACIYLVLVFRQEEMILFDNKDELKKYSSCFCFCFCFVFVFWLFRKLLLFDSDAHNLKSLPQRRVDLAVSWHVHHQTSFLFIPNLF